MNSEFLLNAIGNADDKIIDDVLNNKSKRHISISKAKKITVILIAAIIVAAGCSVAVAKNFVSSWSYHITDGIVQEGAQCITIDNSINIEENTSLSKDEIKSNFNISFISSDKMNNKYLYQPIKEDNLVMRVDLWNEDAYREGDKWLCVWACFWTQNATEEYNPGNNDLDAAGDKIVLETYPINEMNCDAVIYTFNGLESRISADILYENVSYNYMFNNFSIEEVKEVLDSLYV